MTSPQTQASAQATAPAAEPSPLDAALASLAATRARLRAGLIPADDTSSPRLDAQGRPVSTSGTAALLAAWWRRGRRALRAWPVADLAAGLLQDGWQRHPWRHTGQQLADAARQAVLPLVRRHPLSALLAATALGAALVAVRPWRWQALRPVQPVPPVQQVRPLRPDTAPAGIGPWLAAQLANPAVQTALLSAVMLIVKQLSEAPARRPMAPGASAAPCPAAPSAPPAPPAPPG